jgi:uncharacterized protein YkwD
MAQILLRYNLMRFRIIITLLAIILFLVFSVSSSQSQDVPSQYEQDLLQLINQARENPLAVATSLGMDADQILRDLPDLKDILIYGLPPLSFNESLYAAASTHTRDMLENGYYSHTSLDGRTFEERIRASDYVPIATGESESLGMLAFFNFIQPTLAVALIFENMFRDELNPARTERRNILAGDLEEAGIGFGSGSFKIYGSIYNVYLTTCDFGSSVRKLELGFFNLINQARSRPLDVAASLGMDPDQVLADFPELYDILTEGLPPLAFNLQLYTAASAHADDMMSIGYFSHDSYDGRTCHDRIVEAGYDPEMTGECLGMRHYHPDTASPGDEAQRMFYDIYAKELGEENQLTENNILNPDLKEVGVSFIGGRSEGLSTICGDHVFFLVADFGAPVGDLPLRIVGVVYEDRDNDLMYDQSEGLSMVSVNICGETVSTVIYTNEAGGFSKVLPCGQYRVSFEMEGIQMVEWVEIAERSESLFMRIPLKQDHDFD